MFVGTAAGTSKIRGTKILEIRIFRKVHKKEVLTMAKISKQTKQKIMELHAEGVSLFNIAKMLNLPIGSVSGTYSREKNKKICPQCGKAFSSTKKVRFCSAECRQAWWNSHMDQVHKRKESYYTKTCAYCGKVFTVYGDDTRKYCCHDCYCKARYGNRYGKYTEK